MKVYTSIKTLKETKRILSEVGLGRLVIDGSIDKDIKVSSLLNELLDNNKLVEFLQAITRNDSVDFETMPLSEVKEIISSFFTDIVEFLPKSVVDMLKASMQTIPSS